MATLTPHCPTSITLRLLRSLCSSERLILNNPGAGSPLEIWVNVHIRTLPRSWELHLCSRHLRTQACRECHRCCQTDVAEGCRGEKLQVKRWTSISRPDWCLFNLASFMRNVQTPSLCLTGKRVPWTISQHHLLPVVPRFDQSWW